MALGTLALRLVVGGLIAGHGLQKLTGSFDGPGLEGTEQMMGALDLHPARRQALAAAWTETASRSAAGSARAGEEAMGTCGCCGTRSRSRNRPVGTRPARVAERGPSRPPYGSAGHPPTEGPSAWHSAHSRSDWSSAASSPGTASRS